MTPLQYFPREKEILFLHTPHGKKLIELQTVIDGAIYRSQNYHSAQISPTSQLQVELVVADILGSASKKVILLFHTLTISYINYYSIQYHNSNYFIHHPFYWMLKFTVSYLKNVMALLKYC
jgi:hypothetical protein